MYLDYNYTPPKYLHIENFVYNNTTNQYECENCVIDKPIYNFITVWNSCSSLEEVAELYNIRPNRARKRCQKIRKLLWDRIFMQRF